MHLLYVWYHVFMHVFWFLLFRENIVYCPPTGNYLKVDSVRISDQDPFHIPYRESALTLIRLDDFLFGTWKFYNRPSHSLNASPLLPSHKLWRGRADEVLGFEEIKLAVHINPSTWSSKLKDLTDMNIHTYTKYTQRYICIGDGILRMGEIYI